MATSGLLLAAIAFLNLAIGLLVYSRNLTAPLNRAFAFTASAVACWTAALAWGRFQPESFESAIRSAFASASFGPIGILFFTEYFGADTPAHRNRLRLLALAGAAFSALSLTSPWMVSEVVKDPNRSSFRSARRTWSPCRNDECIRAPGRRNFCLQRTGTSLLADNDPSCRSRDHSTPVDGHSNRDSPRRRIPRHSAE